MIANLKGTPARLSQMAIGATLTTLYTAPADGRVAILDMLITNTTGGALTASIYIGSQADANAVGFSAKSIAANTYEHYSGFLILNSGEVLKGIGSGAGLTITITGLERV